MDLTRCAKSMPHLEGKDKQTLGDLIKPRSGTTDYKETVEAHRRLMQFISDNNIGRVDVGQITIGMGHIALRRKATLRGTLGSSASTHGQSQSLNPR